MAPSEMQFNYRMHADVRAIPMAMTSFIHILKAAHQYVAQNRLDNTDDEVSLESPDPGRLPSSMRSSSSNVSDASAFRRAPITVTPAAVYIAEITVEDIVEFIEDREDITVTSFVPLEVLEVLEVLVPNVDCLETMSECTELCEAAAEREYAIVVQPEADGRLCRGPAACQIGDGGCGVDPVDPCAEGGWGEEEEGDEGGDAEGRRRQQRGPSKGTKGASACVKSKKSKKGKKSKDHKGRKKEKTSKGEKGKKGGLSTSMQKEKRGAQLSAVAVTTCIFLAGFVGSALWRTRVAQEARWRRVAAAKAGSTSIFSPLMHEDRITAYSA